MKIGICTIVDYNNYGNRLQNYALQKVLTDRGHTVETLKNTYTKKSSLDTKIKKLLSFSEVNKKLRQIFFKRKNKDIDSERIENFKRFTDNYIFETKNSFHGLQADFSSIDDFDSFIIGSDQVWNYSFSRFSDFDFAMFTTKPKMSYAASFGVSSIPTSLTNKYAKGLNQIEFISVREVAGKNIVENISNNKATVVLDPTLLLDKKDWTNLINEDNRSSSPFILTYFLNKPKIEDEKYIKTYAENLGFPIKNLADRTDRDLWKADPSEFIRLFSQAEAIFTDSFHACVFSILFEKEFEVFERNMDSPSMNSRIETLLEDLNLSERWHNGKKMNFEKINYTDVNKLLEARKKESLKFLDDSLEQIKLKLEG